MMHSVPHFFAWQRSLWTMAILMGIRMNRDQAWAAGKTVI